MIKEKDKNMDTNEFRFDDLYTKLCDGTTMSDAELKCFHKRLKQLVEALRGTGPVFKLAQIEACRNLNTVEGYIAERKEARQRV